MDQLRSLRVFVRVVAEGSFAAAARALELAPAVVTRSVAELEQHLGVRLLNRTTRRIALTDIGSTYLANAQRVLDELDAADALAGSSTRHPRGLLRVLCPPAFAAHQLARHLPAFRAAYPQLGLEVCTPRSVETADDAFDVSIVSVGLRGLQGDFVARPLARSAFLICASPEYVARRGRPLQPDDLLQHDAILPAVGAVRREVTLYRCSPAARRGAAHSVTLPLPRAALTTPHVDMMLAAAVSGLGVAGLPSFVADAALRDGRLERLLPDWRGVTLALYAAMPTRKHVPARSRVFVDFLVRTFGPADLDPWVSAI